MKNVMKLTVISVSVLFASSSACRSEDYQARGIQSQGEAVLERKPELMRMTIDLLAKGDTMAEAVAKMKTRRTKVEEQLVTLGALKDSWTFGEIRLDQRQIIRRKQFQMMIRHRVGMNAGRMAKDKELDAGPTPVDLTMRLTAEWSITEAGLAGDLVAIDTLQESIRMAKLSGSEDSDDISEEAAELAEELEGIVDNGTAILPGFSGEFENPTELKPGEPSFLFVAKISAADRQKALSEAFLAAKMNASQLVQAAGMVLGPLRNISNPSGVGTEDLANDQLLAYQQIYNSTLRQQLLGGNNANEAIGATLGTLKYKVTVNTTFDFK